MITYNVYKIFLKSEKQPYAFTINKKMKDDFLYQRNKNLFYVKKEKMDENEYKAFSYMNKKYMLLEIPLNPTPTSYSIIIGTYDEENKLMYHADLLDKSMENLYRRLVLQSHINKKYTESIEYLTKTYFLTKTKDSISTINLFALFLKVCENTFKDVVEYDDE